jgi:hypothetical protein
MSDVHVYIWILNEKIEDSIDKYIQFDYSIDGTFIPSQFMKEAGFIDFDHSYVEINENLNYSDIYEAFNHHSYISSFKEELILELENQNIKKVKSYILVYEYRYREDKIANTNADPKSSANITFIGKFHYHDRVPV